MALPVPLMGASPSPGAVVAAPTLAARATMKASRKLPPVGTAPKKRKEFVAKQTTQRVVDFSS